MGHPIALIIAIILLCSLWRLLYFSDAARN